MAVYKRKAGGAWWVRFTVRGKTVRRSSGTTDRARAEEYETALRERYWRQDKLGESVHFWSEAVKRYKREAEWREKTRESNEYALTFFTKLNDIAVAAIDADVARAARDYVERTQSPTSANRIMAVFRGVLHRCVKWGWLKYAPPVPMAHIPQATITPLTPEQCRALLDELPEHLRAPFTFAVLTGLRQQNVCQLQWSQVDLEAARVTVSSSHYKTKRDYAASLSAAAVDILKAQPKVSAYVFTYRKKPVTRFNNHAYRKARKRAGLPNVRWHDLRHTFASWMAQGGASDRVLQQAGGWTSSKMVARYAHLRPDDLRPHVDAVGTIMVTALSKDQRAKSEKDL